MSYQGYTEYLCEDGHYWTQDAFDDPVVSCVVSGCPRPVAWTHEVDQTNGTDPNEPWSLPTELEVDEPMQTETCNLGHVHVVRPPRYKIPTA